MRKKPCSFPTVPAPLSPTPPSPASSSTPGIRHGHWKPPTPLAPPPGQTKFPSLNRGAPPHLRAPKGYGVQVISEVPSYPCPAIPSSPLDLHPVLLNFVPNFQSPYAPLPPSHLSLASGHPCRRRTRACIPPAQPPPPTISSLWDPPGNCPRNQVSQTVGTQNSQSFVNRAPAGRREHNRLGSRYR